MFKPSYVVVTSVLVVLAILAFARHAFERFIPPAATNRLAEFQQKFLSSAGHQPIDWHLVEESPFSEAFLSGKPILLLVGISTGKANQEFGSSAFEDVDIARFVAQNFFCIRVDGYEHPEWLNAILPVSRMKLEMKPGFQAWVLNPDGRVVTNVSHSWGSYPLDAAALLSTLAKVRDEYDALSKDSLGATKPVDMQQTDLNLLGKEAGEVMPDFNSFIAKLTSLQDPQYGGFPEGGNQTLYPSVWRFLTLTGNKALWKSSLSPLLYSRLLDVQDGGFFRTGIGADIHRVEFDKNTCQNSELMLDLAIEGQIQGDVFDYKLARSAFDWLLSTTNAKGLLAAAQQDDETPQGRSPRLSFPSWRMGDCLSGLDFEWASDHLGLDISKNEQMTPYLKSRSTYLDPNFDRVLGELRSNTTTSPEYSDLGYLDVNGHAMARMLEVARLWGDGRRIGIVANLVDRLSVFKTDSDLIHRVNDRNRRLGYLGDFLAFSDAKLQLYLATGKASALEEGLQFLNTARIVFRSTRPGQLNLSRNADEMGGLEAFCVPEISDNLSESCTAQAIRLLLAYGRLTSDTEEGQTLLHEARLATSEFVTVAATDGPVAGGYYCAAAEVADGTYAVAVGPQASTLADRLYRRVPTRFVVPALGSFRRDLQAKKPGLYIIGNTVKGPFTVDEALRLLPPTLALAHAP